MKTQKMYNEEEFELDNQYKRRRPLHALQFQHLVQLNSRKIW